MRFTVIGLTGPAGSGKDTVGDILVRNHNFVKIALADPLKNGISAMFGISNDVLNYRDLKEKPHPLLCNRTPRYVMQTLGTEWGRNLIADDIWTRIADQTIKKYKKNAFDLNINGVVITDIRFESEAKWFRSISNNLWHIKRNDNPYHISSDHISENGIKMLDEDWSILNNFSIDELERMVNFLYSLTYMELSSC